MEDIFREVEEDLRRDRYHRLVSKYGVHVAAIALAVVLGTTGTVLWKNWRTQQRQADTQTLALTLDSIAGNQGNPIAAETLEKVAPSLAPGPAGLARFYAAGLRARTGDAAGAAGLYDALAADASIDPLYRGLATLLSVQLQLGTGEPAALAARLEPLAAETSPWRFSAREVTALLALRGNDRTRAQTLFQQLADDRGAPPGLRTRAGELAAFFGKSP